MRFTFFTALVSVFVNGFDEDGFLDEEVAEDFYYSVEARELFKLPPPVKFNTPPPIHRAPYQAYLPQKQVETAANSGVVRELSCPSGMTLHGRQCYSRQITPLQQLCPAHSFLNNFGECITKSRPMIVCPEGYALQDSVCNLWTVTPATFVCNDDEILEGSDCVKTVPLPGSCPGNFVLTQEGLCEMQLPTLLQCPNGYNSITDDSKECTRSSIVNAKVVCPDGSDFAADSQKCVFVHQDPPRCPKKFVFSAETQQCVQGLTEVFAACPQGFEPDSTTLGVCRSIIYSKPEFICSEGYSLVQGTCSKEVPVAPKCPSDYHPSVDGVCEKVVRGLPQCPPGATMTQEMCETFTRTPLVATCLPGYVSKPGDLCSKQIFIPSELSCTIDCFQVKPSRVAYACPESSKFVDDPAGPKCLRQVVQGSNCKPLPERCMDETNVRSAADDPECKEEPGCHVEIDVMLAQAYCPEGGDVEGNKCVLREPIQPVKICREGTFDETTGNCVTTINVQAQYDCPMGSYKEGMQQCVRSDRFPPNITCPPGSVIETSKGLCVMHTSLVTESPMIESIAPQVRCPAGSQLEGNNCKRTTTVDASLECPPNSLVNLNLKSGSRMRCYITTNLIIPPPFEKIVRPSSVCSEGVPVGTACRVTESIPAITACPEGSTLVERKKSVVCVKDSQKLVQQVRKISNIGAARCEEGATLKGSMCINKFVEAAMIECSEGYAVVNGECIRKLKMDTYCPTGTTISSDGCVMEFQMPATVRIIQGCVHTVNRSCATCPRDVSSTCHRM